MSSSSSSSSVYGNNDAKAIRMCKANLLLVISLMASVSTSQSQHRQDRARKERQRGGGGDVCARSIGTESITSDCEIVIIINIIIKSK